MAHKNFGGVNDFSWDDGMEEMGMFEGPRFPGGYRNKLYGDAYGDYRGGYPPRGPPFGFNPRCDPHFFNRPPRFLMGMGRGFGPRGGPSRRGVMEDPIIKYLLKCGVPKDSLKNLPRELLLLMEPESCGLCGQSFQSFSSSRIHYVSKNHSKNMKKWVAQNVGPGVGNIKQAPLRARELYCELCDVHITSTQHADSHYAGKPHRLVVEGRKNPKNSVLLQKNMEERLQQLIRREKKHVKAIAENETPESKASEAGQEKKNIQSDLYCDICKTSVTCTEQMTLHLNGKKHLSKEKQHILMVMRGEKIDTKDNEPNTDTNKGTEVSVNSEEVKAEKGENQNDAAVNEWGNENVGEAWE